MIRGKRTDLGLGGWPLVPLNDAREKAMENRRIARVGGDPRTEKRDVPTFAEAAAEVIKLNEPNMQLITTSGLAAKKALSTVSGHQGVYAFDDPLGVKDWP